MNEIEKKYIYEEGKQKNKFKCVKAVSMCRYCRENEPY